MIIKNIYMYINIKKYCMSSLIGPLFLPQNSKLTNIAAIISRYLSILIDNFLQTNIQSLQPPDNMDDTNNSKCSSLTF